MGLFSRHILRAFAAAVLISIQPISVSFADFDLSCYKLFEVEPASYPPDTIKNTKARFEKEKTSITDDYIGALNDGLSKGYRPVERTNHLVLSGENGREKLEAVRIVLSDEWTLDVLKDYLQVMDKMPSLKLMAVYPKKFKNEVDKTLGGAQKSIRNRVNIKQLENVKTTAEWTQDGSKPLISKQPTSLASSGHARPVYREMLDEFQKENLVSIENSHFTFEGGNVVVGDRHVFTGTNTAEKMMEKFKITRANALTLMEAEWGGPVFEIGVAGADGAKQLDFHIDLTMTVLYSPKKKKEVILLGSTQKFFDQIAELETKDFKTRAERNVLKALTGNMSDQAYRERYLSAVEKKLIEKNYEVIRVPYFNDGAYPLINYNNVVISENQVIFPLNGFRKLDVEMLDLYHKLGFETIPVEVVQKSFQYKGGIRCLSETFRSNRVAIPR